jgi:hypothetical protein
MSTEVGIPFQQQSLARVTKVRNPFHARCLVLAPPQIQPKKELLGVPMRTLQIDVLVVVPNRCVRVLPVL